MEQKSQYIFQRSVDLCFFPKSVLVADYLKVKVAAEGNNSCSPLSAFTVCCCELFFSPLFFFPLPYFKLPELAEQDLRASRRTASCNMWLWSQDENMDVGALSIYGKIYG